MPAFNFFHGTSSENLASIARSGVLPRRHSKINNYKHTVGSNPSAVYLTDAYPLHFAMQATKGKEPLAILEFDPEKVSVNIQADEDALEQSFRGNDDLPGEWTMKQRTIYYRKRAHNYSGELSMRVLGTCGHKGIIPANFINRVALIEHATAVLLVMSFADPTITILNNRLMGPRHRHFSRWLMGHERFIESERIGEDGNIERFEYNERNGIHLFNDVFSAVAALKEGLPATAE